MATWTTSTSSSSSSSATATTRSGSLYTTSAGAVGKRAPGGIGSPHRSAASPDATVDSYWDGRCRPKLLGRSPPSLFCFSVMRPETPELELLRLQVARQTGIFACEDFSVFSHNNQSVQLCSASDGLPALMTEALPAAPAKVGSITIPGQTTNSWLNAKTFMQAWDKITTQGRFRRHQWVAKTDPDAVFLPERLRARLRGLNLPFFGNYYILNCDMWGRRLFGALEVYSRGAIEAYAIANRQCKTMKWQGWGEDYYMQHCMDALGVKPAKDFKMISDFNGHCTKKPPSTCAEGRQAAFHPLKVPDAFKSCLEQAVQRHAAI